MSRQRNRSASRAHRRGRSQRPALLSACVVVVVAAIGGWALVATRPKPPSNPAPVVTGSSRASADRPAPPATPGRATVSIAWVGDMSFGTLNDWPADGTGSLLDAVTPYLHSNLTIGNLETALGDLPMSKCKPREKDCYQFEAPPATAKDLRQDGFSAVNVANNHTLDAGSAGEVSTDDALRAARLRWAGRQ